tara:strand:+ start:21783 stop:22439 length:657 start_codon:yes stop_codon:yes gene_type:complete
VTNNYFLRRLRYTFDFNDAKMIELWTLADKEVTREQVTAWLKKDDDLDFVNCSDRMLAIFLNGLINDMRGKKDGPQMKPEARLNNNIILRKLKIALNLRDDDICEIINYGGDFIGKSELSAFFRKVGHQHYRELQDQMMRKFMQGLQAKHRAPNQQTKNPIRRDTTKEILKKPAQLKTVSEHESVKKSPQKISPEPHMMKETNASQTVNSDIWSKKPK